MNVLSFGEYVNEAVNSHMTHLSDLPFIEGVVGTRKAINFLRDLRNFLKGNGKAGNKLSTKFDGAPAVFLGIDPTDGKFFVAKKGIFNKNPKVYKTQADIDADLSGDLAVKFSILLAELPKLGIKKGIFQGDLMYTKADLKNTTIDGVEYVTMHPNTIVYAVPADSTLAARIKKSKLGIAFHTEYTGNSFDTLEAHFGNKIVPKFKATPSIWAVDAAFDDHTAEATLSSQELKTVDELLSSIGSLFRTAPAATLNQIHKDGELLDLVLIYINSKVKGNVRGESGKAKAEGFKKFIEDRYNKEIEKRKSASGKASQEEAKMRALEYFHNHSYEDIAKIFELADMIDEVKAILIGKLNKINGISHFVRTTHGYKITAPEGFVSINSDNEAVKLVDRFEFSALNFSAEVIKGWTK